MNRGVIMLRVQDRALEARERYRDAAKQLATHLDGVPVVPAYVVPGGNADALSLADAVEQLVSQQLAEITVVPCEVEWKTGEWQDVPNSVQELARAHPDVRFKLAQPFGTATNLIDAIAERCEAAWPAPGVAGGTGEGAETTPAAVTSLVASVVPSEGFKGEVPHMPAHEKHVLACFGRVCQQEDSDEIFDTLTGLLAERGLDPEFGNAGAVKLTRVKCMGPCAGAALVCVYPQGTFYWNLSAEMMPQFVDEVLVGGRDLPEHTFRPGVYE